MVLSLDYYFDISCVDSWVLFAATTTADGIGSGHVGHGRVILLHIMVVLRHHVVIVLGHAVLL